MKRFSVAKGFGIALIALAVMALFSFIVMSLWNGILVGAVHVGVITFWQAAGILVLSKILFSGFRGRGFRGGMHGHSQWRNDMRNKWQGVREKWHDMSPEEREKIKQEWKNQCGGRGMWRRDFERDAPGFTKTEEGPAPPKEE